MSKNKSLSKVDFAAAQAKALELATMPLEQWEAAALQLQKTFLESQPIKLAEEFVPLATSLVHDIAFIQGAVIHGQDDQLKAMIKPFEQSLFDRASKLKYLQFQLISLGLGDVANFSDGSKTKSVNDFVNLIGEYIKAIQRLVSVNGNGNDLRALISLTPYASLMVLRPQFGRPEGLDPVLEKLAILLDEIHEQDRVLKFPKIAKLAYARLLTIDKPTGDDKEQLAWFTSKDPKNWGHAANRLWLKWKESH